MVQASHELLVRDIERAAAEGVVELLVDVEEGVVCTCVHNESVIQLACTSFELWWPRACITVISCAASTHRPSW